MFQHYALFGHMTIFENVAFGLRVRPRNQRPAGVARSGPGSTGCCNWCSSTGSAIVFPASCRVASGSASRLPVRLRSSRACCLLDEPFGALDAKVRQELRRWLRRLHDEVHVTSVFVTHDQEEALEVADRVVVMNHGKIEQIGTPDEVYDHPATPFVFEFLGHVNRLPPSAGMASQGYARPHEFAVLAQPAADAWPARLVHSATVGPVSRLEFALEADRQTINVELPRAAFRALQIVPGTVAYLQPTRVRRFDDAATAG